ncbi:NUDIX domain-containing protein [Bradyrhizobium sp. CCGB12]|uniref:NUDIX hydrolase n=1 Tax=Bradyrhizobium sp. CCGB12 TaxID=2949632 RepID=UPI0020B21DAF|nr:NUDIX domain-containing protein [Bradyrhizobium sp. CCGB12]MCP3389148.1 NUDIX domain-containing protein [Bradyrhizobium sp. CCGB12]
MTSQNSIRIAAALMSRSDGRVLLVRKRATESFMQPGGKIEAGEHPQAALRRELLEELGIEVDPEEMTYVGRYTAPAAHEPGRLVDAEIFRVAIAHSVNAGAEIEEILWLDPSAPGSVKLAPLTRDKLLPLCSRPAGTSPD